MRHIKNSAKVEIRVDIVFSMIIGAIIIELEFRKKLKNDILREESNVH